MPRIELQSLGKVFQNTATCEAVRALNLVVEENTVTALVGPSGCGKTTIIRIMAGLESATSGRCLIGSETPDALRRRGGMSIMFQEPTLLPWKTVRQNVALPLDLIGKPELLRNIEALLKALNLHAASGLYPHQLSGGMAQRAALARALVSEPALLLLDEPFSALDWPLRKHLDQEFEVILGNWRSTVCLVTHDVREAVFLADAVAALSNRPAALLQSFAIPFPHPRKKELLVTSEFLSLCGEIERVLSSQYDGE